MIFWEVMTLIFKKIFQFLWQIIDIICYLGSLAAIDYAAFLMGGEPWLFIFLGISLALIGLLSEIISANRKGGD